MHALAREMADHPRRRPFSGLLFQARDGRELEVKVMQHFLWSHAEKQFGLVVERHLEVGEDPPDVRCHDGAGRRIGVEITELVDPDIRAENAYRLLKASTEGGHERSVPVPEGATPEYARLCSENPCMRVYSQSEGLDAIQQLLSVKDRKIAKRREARGAAWDYDAIFVVAFTDNHTIAESGFYAAAQQHEFGPFSCVDRAFLVSEPFPTIGDGIIELPVRVGS